MPSRLLSTDALTEPLGAPGPAGTPDEPGGPTATTRSLDQLAGTDVGLWEMTVGSCRDVEVDEVFVVLAGRGVLTLADGAEIVLAPGVVVRLVAGERTRWLVSEALRKLYVAC